MCDSFGNMIHPEKRKQAQPEDLAKAALVTVTNTVASIANMCAAAAVSPTHIACHTRTTAATLYTDAATHTTASSTLPCCYGHCAISSPNCTMHLAIVVNSDDD